MDAMLYDHWFGSRRLHQQRIGELWLQTTIQLL